MPEANIEHTLKVEIKRFEGKFALVETEDKQLLRWPIRDLPDDAQEGMAVRLMMSTNKANDESRQRLAREVINSLLAGG
jgi:hypothetical protein